MLETVQQASFLMDSFGVLSKWRRQGRAEQFRITYSERAVIRQLQSWPHLGSPHKKNIWRYGNNLSRYERERRKMLYLGLNIISSYNVSHCSQCRGHNLIITMPAIGQH